AAGHNAEQGYSSYPLYAAQFDPLMWAAIDTETCLKRGWCLPIGGLSTWSTFSENITRDDGKPILLVSSKIDSTSFIRDYALGASSSLTGVVAALGVADALSKRFVQDLTTPFECKSKEPNALCKVANAACTDPCFYETDFRRINFDRIEAIVEFDSVAGLWTADAATRSLYMHVDEVNAGTTALMGLFGGSTLAPGFNSTASLNVTITPASEGTTNLGLPPSSVMSFLQKNKSIPAVVLADYRTSFSNKYYNTEYDDGALSGGKQYLGTPGSVRELHSVVRNHGLSYQKQLMSAGPTIWAGSGSKDTVHLLERVQFRSWLAIYWGGREPIDDKFHCNK
ncbi:hypothetical protein HK104_000756, partial [Borealophlyctis nickersoniae]